jgi:hypothetical protein
MPFLTVKYARWCTEIDGEGRIHGDLVDADATATQFGNVIVEARNFGDAEDKVLRKYKAWPFWDVEVESILRARKGIVPEILR